MAEGVETIGEYRVLRDLGIDLFRDCLFARPALESPTDVDPGLWDALDEDLPQA